MKVLTDEEWKALKAALDAVRSRRRRPMEHERQTAEAVIWRLKNDAKSRAIPPELGPCHRAATFTAAGPCSASGSAPSSASATPGTTPGTPPGTPMSCSTARASAPTLRPPGQKGARLNALGRALAFRLLPGHRSELKASDALLIAVTRLGRARGSSVGRVVCDRGYSLVSWRVGIRRVGAEPVVPANRRHPAVAYNRAAYQRRYRVEQLGGA